MLERLNILVLVFELDIAAIKSLSMRSTVIFSAVTGAINQCLLTIAFAR